MENQEVIQLINYLSNRYNTRIVINNALVSQKITMNLGDTDVNTVVKMLARLLNTKLIYEGGIYYIGDLRAEDQSTFFSKVYKYEIQEIVSIFSTLTTPNGKVSSTADGALVVSDTQEVISRCINLLHSIENLHVSCWLLQLLIADISDSRLYELGLQTEFLFEATQILINNPKLDTNSFIKGVIKSDTKKVKRKYDTNLTFLLKDGTNSAISLGGQYPIIKSTINGQTGGITQDTQFIDIGQSVKVFVRDDSKSTCKIKLDISFVDVINNINGLPILSRFAFQNESVYESNNLYLVGSIDIDKNIITKTGQILPTLKKNDKEKNQIRIFLRTYKIEGQLK